MAPKRTPRFELGLVMAGAVSGGAYTAGVVDFLIQALDQWERLKTDEPGSVPTHEVRISVMSGASAGAMTSAMAAVAFGCEIEPVVDVDRPPAADRNRLFDAWVRQIDIDKLLGVRDLDGSDRVTSLLDCSSLRDIALGALQGRPRSTPRPYIADPLMVILTVANLRGVPYGFHLFGSTAGTLYGMSNHMDDVRFAISPKGATVAGALTLDPAAAPGNGWPILAEAALASGAFPIGLQPRLLERPAADFDGRLGRGPTRGGGPAPQPYKFLCVDGGLMNNEPLEQARRYLAGRRTRNPREAERADKAVLMIDPFPNLIQFDSAWQPDDRVVKVAAGMFSALINQARFKPEELALAEDDDVYSRWVISPSYQDRNGKVTEPAMAAAILGGFGGFFHESFRRHDFQLGRRNCQAFLARHFQLPATHPLFAAMDESTRDRFTVRDAAGNPELFETRDGRHVPFMPIIPLAGDTAEPIPLPPRPHGSAVDGETLKKAVRERVEKVGDKLIHTETQAVTNGFVRWLAKRAWGWQVAPRISDEVMKKITTELARL